MVIVTIQAIASNERTSRFLLPKPAYRPGVGQTTLDFPGGRVLAEQTTVEAAKIILQRELDIEESDLIGLKPINQIGWAINSSFSNQKLFGLVAEIDSQTVVNPEKLTPTTYTNTVNGIDNLLQDLTCLQCRAVLLEWQQSI